MKKITATTGGNTSSDTTTADAASSSHRPTTVMIDTISGTIPDPETFYETYIYPRRPVVLTTGTSTITTTTLSEPSNDVVVVDSAASEVVVPADPVVVDVVPTILENPMILQFNPFLETLQRIIQKFSYNSSSRQYDDGGGDDVDADDQKQYDNMEVSVRQLGSTAKNNACGNRNSKSVVVKLPFHDIYQKIFIEQNEHYYITTPTLPLVQNMVELGQPDIMTFFTKQVRQQYHQLYETTYIPLRPKLFGQLIPMNVGNIWIGCTHSTTETCNDSPSSYSSGLHHDYHDNLYCLIHGTKIIRLAPPESIYDMEMMGTLHTLHPNGRIVYHEQIVEEEEGNSENDTICPIRPDGALVSVERIVQLEIRKEEIESEIVTYGRSNNDDTKTITPNARIEELEDELNAIEEQLLDIEMSGNPKRRRLTSNDTDYRDDDNDEKYDDDDDDDDNESEEEGIFFGKQASLKGRNSYIDEKVSASDQPSTPKKQKCHIPNAQQQHEPGPIPIPPQKTAEMSRSTGSTNLPPNFVKQYDPSKVSFQSITMHAGDALYIPAGWFHEVTSIGCDSTYRNDHTVGTTNTNDANTETAAGIHMAINYWYHPPDVGDDLHTKINFHQPYRSQFWQRDWDQRQLE